MSFMFRDRKETDFAYSNVPEPPYTKSELEEKISIMEDLVSEAQQRVVSFRKELALYRVALNQKFYKVG